jgi:hypothetical protein
MVNHKHMGQKGFSTIEILIAVSIMVGIFSAVIMLVLGSQKLTGDTEIAHEAQLLNQKNIEEARNESIINFNISQPAPTIVPVALPNGSTFNYQVTRTQNYISPCVKNITSKVEWTVEGRAQFATTTTQISNPNFVFASGSECNIPSNSLNAQCNQSGYANLEITGEVSPNQDAYDLEVTRINNRVYAFIVTHPSNSTQRPEDFWIYDITTNQSPADLIAYKDINALPNVGINSIKVISHPNGSHYSYMANDDTTNRLFISNVTDPSNIAPATPFDINGSGNNLINDIQYLSSRLYVAIGNDVKVYNVTDPLVPLLITSINLGGKVNKLDVNTEFLFAATADNTGELAKINLADYTVTKYNLNGNSSNNPATSIKVVGNRIFLGIQSGQNEDNLYIIDDANPGWTVVSSHNLPHQNNKRIIDHQVTGNFLYALVQEASKEFQIYDISNVNNFVEKCTSTNPTNVGFGLELFENKLYLSMRANSELQIYSE